MSREHASRGGRDATTAIDAEDVEDVVSTEALQAALRTVEALNARIAVSPAQAVVEIAKDVDRWGPAVLVQAYAMIVYSALQQAAPPEPSDEEPVPHTAATAPGGEGDAPGLLDTIVPAVVLRFNRLRLSGDLDRLTETDVALAAGALTAGAMDMDIYRWRTELGPLYSGEPLMWCYLAWLVADFVDSVVFQEDGAFARILTSVLDAQ